MTAPTAKPTPARVGWIFAAWVGVLTALTLPLALINPVFIGIVQDGNDVADRMRLPQGELDQINQAIVWDIFTGGEFDLAFSSGKPVLGPAERSHMDDVSRLVQVLVMLDLAAVVFAAWGGRLLRTEPRRLGRLLIAGAGIVGVATIAIGVFAVVAWDSAFTLFHRIFFPGGNWSFPADSSLIQLYPGPFWFEAAVVAGTLIVLTAVAISYGGWRQLREGDGAVQAAADATADASADSSADGRAAAASERRADDAGAGAG